MPMTNLQKLEALLWGSFWSALGGITTGMSDLIASALEGHPANFQHVLHRAYIGMAIGIFHYWQKQQALFTPSPVLIEDTTQTVRTPAGQPDIVVQTHKETTTVSSEAPKVGP